MASPNFFLVGAPKCGTTSLYAWLATHPNVFIPKEKEPDFFADEKLYRNVSTLEDYMALYEPADGNTEFTAIGDASTTYIQTNGALENIRAFNPDAKIVIAVRNPIDVVQSMHSHRLFFQAEDIEDFEQAWRMGPEREQGRSLPKTARPLDHTEMTYMEFGQLGKRVKHALEIFPANQVHVVVFDDMKADPMGTYRSLLEFLGLEYDGRDTFDVKNVSRSHGKAGFLSRMLTGMPRPVSNLLRKIGLKNTGLGDKLLAKVTTKTERPVLDPRFRDELADFFRPDVQILESVLNRDLSKWTRVEKVPVQS